MAARQIAQDLGIPTIPGTNGPLKDLTKAYAFAEEYVVLCGPSALAASIPLGLRKAESDVLLLDTDTLSSSRPTLGV